MRRCRAARSEGDQEALDRKRIEEANKIKVTYYAPVLSE
jgi:hypothetical protein